MIGSVKAVLVFCEGPHDIAFVRLVFREILNFKPVKKPFKELPSPFHQLFKQSVSTHAAMDLSLDMAHKFFLPDSILRKDDDLILLFNTGGKTQYDKVKTLLSDYFPMFSTARTFAQGATEVVDSVRYLFLYDADHEGLDGVQQNVSREFLQIGDIDFLTESWLESSISAFGKVSGDKGLFVWGVSPVKGTLEDILLPMFFLQDSERLERAEYSIDDMFSWNTDHPELKKAVAEIGKKKKAIMTLAGQKEKPGSSMNVILEQSGLLTKNTLEINAICREFVSFVKQFMGL